MRSIFLSKKNLFLKIIFIFFSILYLFEFILSYKTHSFNYLMNRVFNKNLISIKIIDDYIFSHNGFLTLGNNNKYEFFCEHKKKSTLITDKHGLINNNQKWDGENKILLLQTKGDLNCGNFNLIRHKIKFKTNQLLNFGSYSIGPLHQYALVKKFAANKVFKKIVWIHFEGSDLSEQNNKKDLDLINFFNSDDLIDNLAAENQDDNFNKFTKMYNYKIFKRTFKNFITFYYTKNLINKFKFNKQANIKKIKIEEVEQFVNIFFKTHQLFHKNLTDIYFVYIPTINENVTSEKNKTIKKIIKEKLNKNGIKFIDLREISIRNNNRLLIIDTFIN